MLVIEPLDGDLTRVGSLPERAFGGRQTSIALPRRPSTASAREAKIVVIGDSFSQRGLWQYSAFGAEEKYVTFAYGQICEDIGNLFRKLGLEPTVVVVETVERMFAERMFSSCKKSQLRSLAASKEEFSDSREMNIFRGSFSAKYVGGSLLYFVNGGEQHRMGHNGGVFVREIELGCMYFSHRDCKYGLFLGDDYRFPKLPLTVYRSPILKYLKATGVKKIVVVSIPNKSSIYLQSVSDAREADEYLQAFARRNGVEVVPVHSNLIKDKRAILDLYLPNDTHLSARGMSLLGGYVRERLRE